MKKNKLKKFCFLSLFSINILFAQTISIQMEDPTNKTKLNYSSLPTSTWGGTTAQSGPLLSALISERIMGPVTESTGKGPVLNINQLVVLVLIPNTSSKTPKHVPMVINVISSGVMNTSTSSCLTKIKSLPFVISSNTSATTKPTPSMPSEVKPDQVRIVRLDDMWINPSQKNPNNAPFIINAVIPNTFYRLSELTRNVGDDSGAGIQTLSYQNLINCPAFK